MEAYRIVFVEQAWETAWRYGSLELNNGRSRIRGVRLAGRKGWAIYSTRSPESWNTMLEKAAMMARKTRGSLRLASTELYVGHVELGRIPEDPSSRMIEAAAMLGGLLEEKGMTGEIVVVARAETRRIEHSSGIAEENRGLTEIYVYADARIGSKRSVGSSMAVLLGSPEQLEGRMLEELVEKAARRAFYGLKAEALSPLERGRHEVILAGEAAAALLHELGHLLEADQPVRLRRGARISNTSITVRDDPFMPASPSSRAFDDEAVRCTRRVLVEEGVIRDLLHTRETAYRLGGAPGSARGLFTIPKAMHTTLVLEPGDWREKEIIEETRRGLLVDGVIRAELEGMVVTLKPEEAWIVEKGEPVKPVMLSRLVLPLRRSLLTINAMGRSLYLRTSREKGELVSEASPWIRLQGYAE